MCVWVCVCVCVLLTVSVERKALLLEGCMDVLVRNSYNTKPSRSCGQNFPTISKRSSLCPCAGNGIVPCSHNSLIIFFPCGCLLCMSLLASSLLCGSGTGSAALWPSSNLQPPLPRPNFLLLLGLLVYDLMLTVWYIQLVSCVVKLMLL